MTAGLVIRLLQRSDSEPIEAAFAAIGWNKPRAQYQRYCDEQDAGVRQVWVGELGGAFAGYVTLHWRPTYPGFVAAGIPEVQDLNVLPQFRRRGIASALMDEVERLAFSRYAELGIGVGLHAGYNAAQRMYVLRGYVPDGKGVVWHDRYVGEYETVVMDDDLVLCFTKRR